MEESLKRRLIRYTIVVAIVVVLGGMYVQREILTDDELMVAVPAPAATETADATDDSATDDGSSADGTGGTTMVQIGLVDDRSVQIDELAPDFRLTDLDGNVVMLSDFRGKTVVLNFWATWCPPCREEMPEFQELWEHRGSEAADDLVVLAVNFLRDDTVGAATNFIAANEFTFPVVFDTTRGDVAARYGVRGLPATFFIDRNGIVRTTALGPVFGNLLEMGVADADTEGGTVQ
ncbi:MAG: TlpA family protein disulfide reductase [Chloroflexi bacterium]|nr:TlpA family protein disulfide reductase [Chloroflexota bacterium]MYE32614.1 TlpA family protein disulfide reductase [Chloroflexota bacterium]